MATTALGANTNRDKPNIVLLFSDDQGWNDIGWNNPKVHTPNLDRLRKQGNNHKISNISRIFRVFGQLYLGLEGNEAILYIQMVI